MDNVVSSFKNLFDAKASAEEVTNPFPVFTQNGIKVAMKEIDKIKNIYKILQQQPEQEKKWIFPDDFIHTSMSIQLGKMTVDVRDGETRKLFLTGAMHDLEMLSLLRHKWYTVSISTIFQFSYYAVSRLIEELNNG